MDRAPFTPKKVALLIAFAAVLLLAVLNFRETLGLLSYLFGLFMPLFLGVCMAFVLNVLMRFIENRLLGRIRLVRKGHVAALSRALKRPLSLVLTLLVVLGIVAFVTAMIIPTLRDTIASIVREAPGFTRRIIEWGNGVLEGFGVGEDAAELLAANWQEIARSAVNFLSGVWSTAAKSAMSVTASVFSVFTNFLFGFVFMIYILLTKERLRRQGGQLLRGWLPEKASRVTLRVLKQAAEVYGKFVAGQCVEAVIIGGLTCIGVLVINPRYAVMLGVLVGFTALIPVIGAFIGIIVGALLLLMVSPWQALAFVIFIVVLQQLENHIIYPKVVGKSIGLPGMWVLLAVLLGGSLNGVFGIVLGVPLAALLYSLLREATAARLRKRVPDAPAASLEGRS
ncbi:MAG: AI-2E family transporter [Clostridiales Family XIII bacterium]|jgi:predicted PurR-regulated permease PerM|nr:AI-2E family transporter [Clostridiales Family XIII bacterium]